MTSEKENHQSLKAFFSDEYNSLKGYVHSKIRDTSTIDAEDIIQDVALRIFSRSNDLSPINNIASFVYNSIRNKIIDVMRTKQEKLYYENTLERSWTDYSQMFYGDSSLQYSEELKTQLKKAISELKPAHREIILAVDFEGYTYKEISEHTGISQGTLMSRRHRSISILLKKLEAKK